MASETLTLIINADSKDAQQKLKAVAGALKDQETNSKSLSGSLDKLKQNWLAVTATLGTVAFAFKKVVTDASNLQEVSSKFETVFKGQTEIAEKFADTLVNSYAMSTREAKQYLSSVQDLLVPMGMASDKAAQMSNEVVKLAADLGSFNKVSTEQAMMDLQSALVGNYETMKKYGVVLNDTVVKQKAMQMGLWDGKGALDANTKAAVAFQLALDGSAAAQGDMIRTGDSFANVMKKVWARIEDISAGLGSNLLPSLSRLGKSFLDASSSGGVFATIGSAITKSLSLIINTIAALINVFNQWSQNFSKGNKLEAYNEELWKQIRLYQQLGIAIRGYSSENIALAKKDYEAMKQRGEVSNEISSQMEASIKRQSTAKQELQTEENKMLDLKKQEKEISDAILYGEQQKNEIMKEGNNIQQQTNDSKGGSDLSSLEEKLQREKELKQQYELAFHEEMKGWQEEWDSEEEARQDAIFDARLQKAQEFLQAIQTITNTISGLFAQAYQNEQTKLDNWYAKKKKWINDNIKDETKKNQALEDLDDEYNKKKKKNAKDYAKTKKAIAIVEAIVATALGVTNAISQGSVAGFVMAAIIGALGVAQIALIASQEVPEAAEGALIKGSQSGTTILAGEKGKSELVVPFENEEVMGKVGGGLGTTQVIVNVENLYGGDDLPQQVAILIDRALYRLKQNKNSVLF